MRSSEGRFEMFTRIFSYLVRAYWIRLFGAALLLSSKRACYAQNWHAQPVGQPFVYKRAGGKNLTLYVQQPTHALSALHPAIIFFHGGGWVSGPPSQFDP